MILLLLGFDFSQSFYSKNSIFRFFVEFYKFRNFSEIKVWTSIIGVSSTLLTYGGASSGKTYSLFGGEKEHEKGLIERSLEMLIEKRDSQSVVTVSFTEVTCQDQLVDLLKKPGNVGSPMRSVTSIEVDHIDQAARLVKTCQLNRSIHSHQITTIELTRNDVTAGKVILLYSQLLYKK